MLKIKNTKKIFTASVVILMITFQFSSCSKKDKNYKIIKTDELKQMKDSGAKDLVIIDSRNPEEYQDVHIPDSINLPVEQFDDYVKTLPENKDWKLVFYCNGVKCGKSKRAANKAHSKGYRNLYVYAEGMPVWEEQGLPIVKGANYEAKITTTKISSKDLNDLINSKKNDITVVDVRDSNEYERGHIPSAINIPVNSFAEQSGKLDKKKTIIVYCNAGNRSYKAYRKLMKLAYKKYYQSLFADWKSAGFAIEK